MRNVTILGHKCVLHECRRPALISDSCLYPNLIDVEPRSYSLTYTQKKSRIVIYNDFKGINIKIMRSVKLDSGIHLTGGYFQGVFYLEEFDHENNVYYFKSSGIVEAIN